MGEGPVAVSSGSLEDHARLAIGCPIKLMLDGRMLCLDTFLRIVSPAVSELCNGGRSLVVSEFPSFSTSARLLC